MYGGSDDASAGGGGDDDTIVGDPIGREALLAELAHERIPYSPEELVEIADAEMAWCRERMLEASRELGFGEDWKAALEHVKGLHVPPGEQPRLVRALARAPEPDWKALSAAVLRDGAGQPREGEEFQLIDEDIVESGVITPEDVKSDVVKNEDAFGFKGKITYQKGRWNWYGQGAYMGLVSEAGPTSIPTFTGWNLKDSGSGNQVNGLTGLAVSMGNWQVGPNFLWQKPIVGPMPHSDDLAGTVGRPRNVQDDPFAVRYNRETTAAELMVTYDQEPATWMWAWDNDRREGANLAASMSIVWRRHHTTADAGLFISDTEDVYAFAGGTPARDLWEVNWRIVNRLGARSKMISKIAFGDAEPNGDNDRLVKRFSVESRLIMSKIAFGWHLKFNDYGPYDYHHDHNLTYPLQLMGDVSFTLGKPEYFGLPETKFGVRAAYRTLDRYSNRYSPEGYTEPEEGELYPEDAPEGNEWEIRTYLHMAI